MSETKLNHLMNYISNVISREGVLVLYDHHNIKFDKCELYSDFVQSLLHLSFDTYLGDDITDIEQQKNHFKWCWDKNLSNFSEEGIIFEGNDVYYYFLEFMVEVFYSTVDKKKSEHTDKNILKLWNDIFDYNKEKTNSDIDSLIEIYNLIDNSLKRRLAIDLLKNK